MNATGNQENLQTNLEQVKNKVSKKAREIGRDASEINLVVVTKEKPALVVKQVFELGLERIGESYLQEAEFKMDLLEDFPIEWHMIGYIQTGKERQIARRFDVIHSIDRVDVAEKINQEAGKLDKIIPIFLEINVSGEETKHGFQGWKEGQWDGLRQGFEKIFQFEFLKVQGLMTMAPYADQPEKARPYFQKLRNLRDYLQSRYPAQHLEELSMGMSGDYLVAVEEGATYLRIGSAIVGSR